MSIKDVPAICHCGKSMHLSDSQRVMIGTWGKRWSKDKIVKMYGGKSYKIPTYYIILHGLKASEVDTLGFPEIKNIP